MAKWFGPILQPCGCCYEEPPPPPPPPCQCADEDCFAEGDINWQTLKFEAELDDTVTWLSTYKQLFCNAGCKNIYSVWESEWTWSGLSAFNGTYDIPFYVYEDYAEAWIEGDPTAIPCGVWFFPAVTHPVTLVRTNRRYSVPADVYSVYDASACPEQVQTQTDIVNWTMETRSGFMWPALPLPSFPEPFLGPGTTARWDAIRATADHRRTGSVFACTSAPLPAVDQRINNFVGVVAVAAGSATPNFGWSTLGGSRFVGIKRVYGAEPSLKSSDYLWSEYPYGGPGIPISSTQCTLDIEEGQDDYEAIDFLSASTSLVQCNPFSFGSFIPGSLPRSLYAFDQAAWNQRFKLLVNAP